MNKGQQTETETTGNSPKKKKSNGFHHKTALRDRQIFFKKSLLLPRRRINYILFIIAYEKMGEESSQTNVLYKILHLTAFLPDFVVGRGLRTALRWTVRTKTQKEIYVDGNLAEKEV